MRHCWRSNNPQKGRMRRLRLAVVALSIATALPLARPKPVSADGVNRAAAAARAVDWAESKRGVRGCSREQATWNRDAIDMDCGEAWCGVFVWTALTRAGFNLSATRLAYTEYIYDDARAGRGGLVVVPK